MLIRFLAFLGAFCLLIVALYMTGWLDIFFNKEEARSFLQSLGPFRFLGFVLIQSTQVVLAPIPGEVTGIIGGYYFGLFWGVILSTLGLTLGSFVAFSLSRAFGRPLVEKLVDKSVLDRFDYVLHGKGTFLVFMLFLLPGMPKDYLCFILGLGRFTAAEFLVISTTGRLFGTVLLTLSGGYLRYQEYGKLYILIGIAIVVSLLAFLFRNKIEGLLKSLHADKSS